MSENAAAQVSRDLEVAKALAESDPGPDDIVNAARLLMRYGPLDTAGRSVRGEVQRRLFYWKMTGEALSTAARALWQGGYRPGQVDVGYGSGADVSGAP